MPQDKIDTISSILKVWGVHLFAITITISGVEWILKIVSLLIAIGYTLRRWYLMEKKDGDNS